MDRVLLLFHHTIQGPHPPNMNIGTRSHSTHINLYPKKKKTRTHIKKHTDNSIRNARSWFLRKKKYHHQRQRYRHQSLVGVVLTMLKIIYMNSVFPIQYGCQCLIIHVSTVIKVWTKN